MDKKELRRKYTELGHAVQSGIAFCMAVGWKGADPKHLRVGIDTQKSDHGALVKLLLEKGVFTEEEYAAALLEGLEQEIAGYQALFKQLTGKDATFE
jgi:hypothetical protein